MLTCRHVHVSPHCFILTEACSCRLELAYFAGKISKNRLVCENAVALTSGAVKEKQYFENLNDLESYLTFRHINAYASFEFMRKLGYASASCYQ